MDFLALEKVDGIIREKPREISVAEVQAEIEQCDDQIDRYMKEKQLIDADIEAFQNRKQELLNLVK